MENPALYNSAIATIKLTKQRVTKASLNAVLDEEVYIKYSLGFEVCGYV